MLRTENGSPIRYGIGNPGGSDYIGLMPVIVTQDMVGKKIAVFAAVEVKLPGELATIEQHNFIKAIKFHGGRAGIAHSEREALTILLQR